MTVLRTESLASPVHQLHQYRVADVMTAPALYVAQRAPFRELVELLGRHRVGALPVVDDERRVVGIVSASDLFVKLTHSSAERQPGTGKAGGETACQLMTSPVTTTTADTLVVDAARSAAAARVRRMPVADPAGRLVGVVTRSDFLRVFLRTDDEIRNAVIDSVLLKTPHVSLGRVRVDVTAGVVELSGEVDRRAIIEPMVAEIGRIAGVVAVHNGLRSAGSA